MIAIRQSGELLHVTISGECNFAVARELMLTCKTGLHESQTKITRIEILLEKVSACHTCNIGALLLVSEWVHGNFRISVKNSSPDVHDLFESGLLTRHFGSHPTPYFSANGLFTLLSRKLRVSGQ